MDAEFDQDVRLLSDELVKEIFKAVGLAPDGWARQKLGHIFHKATDRMAQIGISFDRHVTQSGFCSASQAALSQFISTLRSRGSETVPAQGPLLVVSNHPGAYDALVISSQLRRDDVKIVISDIPFLLKLPCAPKHFIRATPDPFNRMNVIRASIRHLEQGGTLLIFPSGHIDPDPAVWDNARDSLLEWSRSLDIFLRQIPQTQVLISIVSGVLDARWAHSPLTWLRKEGLDKRRLAEFGQVIQQLISPGTRLMSPAISFAAPLSVKQLSEIGKEESPLEAIKLKAQELFADHSAWALGR